MNNSSQPLLIFALLLLAFISCKSQRHTIESHDMLYEIEFQEGFKDDTVSMKINGVGLFSQKILKSTRGSGTTYFFVKAFKSKKGIEFFYTDNDNKIGPIRGGTEVIFQIRINSKQNTIYAKNLDKKYIGLSKDEQDSVFILQSDIPFMHD